MSETFLIAFKEAFQCTVILIVILIYLYGNNKKNYFKTVMAGVIAAFLFGYSLGYFQHFNKQLWSNETWTSMRFISESLILYAGIVFIIVRQEFPALLVSAGFFTLGFLVFFFEARAIGFLTYDIGAMKGNSGMTTLTGLIGIAAGFAPLFFSKAILKKIPVKVVFTLPGLLILTGALKFLLGGVKGIEEGYIAAKLQKEILVFLENVVRHMQTVLLITEHPFIDVPLSGLAHFLSGDRTAMTFMVIFLMAPPLFALIDLFARPDPVVDDLRVGSQRRLAIAFFRTELINQTLPVLIAFVTIVVMIHAASFSLNPLYEPAPITVRESSGQNKLYIPLSDRLGDFDDKKLRKYVYYYENKQIIFLAILKPDKSVGLALDQCEICRPAEWNKDAQGYAQKGDHLICKYCMTPIAIPTVNSPGGCNPIPIPFKMENNNIVISTDDLIDTFKKAEALEKKGTHF